MTDDPSPIDYFNPQTPDEPPAPPETVGPPAAPAAVIPIAFDAELSRTTDHAAVSAIEAALRAMHIAAFRTDDGQAAGRETVLFVKAADYPQAAEAAARIFARRARVRALRPQRDPVGEENVNFGLGWASDDF